MSGRPEAGVLPEKLAKTELRNTAEPNADNARGFAGDLVDAMYRQWGIKNHGWDTFRKDFFGDPYDSLRDTWDASEDGKKWTDWYNSRRKRQFFRLPPHLPNPKPQPLVAGQFFQAHRAARD